MDATTRRLESGSRRPGRNRRLRWPGVAAGVALTALCLAGGALADRGAVPAGTGTIWVDRAYHSPIERIASSIASHIAGRTVSVRCEGPDQWVTVVERNGGTPSAEAGFVATSWNQENGQMLGISNIAELNGSSICLALQNFAQATKRPLQCIPATGSVLTVLARATTTSSTQHQRLQDRCTLTDERIGAKLPAANSVQYAEEAIAILTLAHEAIHLSGIVGGELANGLAVGDQHAEAKAECYGMQWMPYVAEQLGDTSHDAQTLTDYYWTAVYPQAKTTSPPYWSSACVAGGTLDLQLSHAHAWP